MIELTVTIKGEDSTFRQKSLVYETVVFNENDPIIKNHVEEALNNFNQIPEDIKIRALMVIPVPQVAELQNTNLQIT